MAEFKCKTCGCQKTILKTTLKYVDGKLVVPESICKKCNIYMDDITKFDGFGVAFKAPTDRHGR